MFRATIDIVAEREKARQGGGPGYSWAGRRLLIFSAVDNDVVVELVALGRGGV